ncbi:MAG: hypothetical protein J7M14_07215 [Planctomycetes bacterium]|nr:hypothetical protein [Planctomycetota bacterium]
MKVDKSILSVAGEFAVAAELCRRNLYAQLTLGHCKRIDLLVINDSGRMGRIEVKAKQAGTWPNCRGIASDDSFLVFVDFAAKSETERPDFYVLSAEDWRAFAKDEMARYKAKHPERRIELTDENVLVFHDERNQYGQPYKGVGVLPERIEQHRETWDKIISAMGA